VNSQSHKAWTMPMDGSEPKVQAQKDTAWQEVKVKAATPGPQAKKHGWPRAQSRRLKRTQSLMPALKEM